MMRCHLLTRPTLEWVHLVNHFWNAHLPSNPIFIHRAGHSADLFRSVQTQPRYSLPSLLPCLRIIGPWLQIGISSIISAPNSSAIAVTSQTIGSGSLGRCSLMNSASRGFVVCIGFLGDPLGFAKKPARLRALPREPVSASSRAYCFCFDSLLSPVVQAAASASVL